jgi:hypothetical protein
MARQISLENISTGRSSEHNFFFSIFNILVNALDFVETNHL